jgi:DNA-binding NarL/FixJ family response regulator
MRADVLVHPGTNRPLGGHGRCDRNDPHALGPELGIRSRSWLLPCPVPGRAVFYTAEGTPIVEQTWPSDWAGSRTPDGHTWDALGARGAVLPVELVMITVAIIEDNRLVREGMTDKLNELPDVKVVLAATSFEAEMLKETNPRVVLLDVGLQDKNSLRLAETVKKEMADARVIVMDLLPVHEEIAEFVNAGVAGFILKDATFEDFIGTIRSVAEGAQVLPPRMTSTLFSQIAHIAVKRGRTAALEEVRMTLREREVIALIVVGLSNKEIAQRLNIATDTVKSHVRNVMDKLALHSRLQIAAYAHSHDD